MSKEYFLVTGNHISVDGIGDHLTMLGSLFNQNGNTISLSENIVDGKTNIIIDEFTNSKFNRKLVQSHSKETILILVATEFINTKTNFETFNSFELSWHNIFMLKMFKPIYKFLNNNLYKQHIPNPGISKFLKYLVKKLFKFFLLLLGFLNLSKRVFYDKLRYEGFVDNIQYFSQIIVFHKELYNQYSSYVKRHHLNCEVLRPLFPIIDKKIFFENINNKEYGFYMSGTISDYRISQFEALKNKISLSAYLIGGSQDFINPNFLIKNFKDKLPNYLFSYHPAQTSEWKFLSPVRIYRSFCIDFSIPIIDKYFDDHPIEKLCLKTIDNSFFLDTRNLFLKKNKNHYLNKLIDTYNSDAKKNNKIILSLL